MDIIKDIKVVPWDHQSGTGPFHVIFSSQIWKNDWWVEREHCPGKWQEDPNHNPWRIFRAATSEEIALGNPTSCDSAEDCNKLLCKSKSWWL